MGDIRDPELYKTILDSIQTGVYFADRNHRILFWNAGAERITGYQRHEAVGHLSSESILETCGGQGCELCGVECPLSTTLLGGKPKEANVYLRHKAGHHVSVHTWTVPVRDQHGSILGAASSFDVLRSGLARSRRQSTLAIHGCLDEVTGVPNQSFTKFHLRENLASFAEYQVPFSIVLVQIENFDRFKAAYGHEATMAILEAVVESVRNSIRPTDFLGRWAEDQFLAIALSCTNSGLEKITERMRKIFGRLKLHWWGDELLITTRLGPASVHAGDSVEMLLQRGLDALAQSSSGASSDHNSALTKRAGAEG